MLQSRNMNLTSSCSLKLCQIEIQQLLRGVFERFERGANNPMQSILKKAP